LAGRGPERVGYGFGLLGFLLHRRSILEVGGLNRLSVLLPIAVFGPVLTILGGIYRAFHVPIDQLIPLEQRQPQTPSDVERARRSAHLQAWLIVGFAALMMLLLYGINYYHQRETKLLEQQVAALQAQQAPTTVESTSVAPGPQKTVQFVAGRGYLTLEGRQIPSWDQVYFSLAKLPDPAHTVLVCDLRNSNLSKRDIDFLRVVLPQWAKGLGFAEMQRLEPDFPAAGSTPALSQGASAPGALEPIPPRGGEREALLRQLALATETTQMAEARYHAGLCGETEVVAAREKEDVLRAELTGDRVKVAEVRVAAAKRQLEIAEMKYSQGLSSSTEHQAAKEALELRQAELAAAQRVRGGVPASAPATQRDRAG
jgi:hypothetical protein